MLAAVVDNKFDFVDLFLREGLNLKSFLTLERLLTLYREVSYVLCSNELFQKKSFTSMLLLAQL